MLKNTKTQFFLFTIYFLMGISKLFAQNCDCKDFIYLNDPVNDIIHKFDATDPTVAFTELGTPFSQGIIESPHGSSSDINGNLYINDLRNQQTYKLACDGTILETDVLDPGVPDGFTNSFSIGNTTYITMAGGTQTPASEPFGRSNIVSYDLCSGEQIGAICIEEEFNRYWGFELGLDGCIYSSNNWGIATHSIVKICEWSDQDFIDETCFDDVVFIDDATIRANATVSDYVLGVTSDEESNVYFVTSLPGYATTCIQKYDATGAFVDEVCDTNANDGAGFGGARGLIYKDGHLIIASFDYCLAVVDTSLNIIPGAGVSTPGPVKAVGMTTECCPLDSDVNINRSICVGTNDSKVFLQELISCGEGSICEANWTTEVANPNQSYDDCSSSVTVTGDGCGTYVYEKTTPASAIQQCNPFRIEIEVCAILASAEVSALPGSCSGSTVNDDASILISNIMNVDEANLSLGTTYTGPAYGGPGAVDISSGSGTITGLMHNTTYTVRVFNAGDDCYSDYTITTPGIECTVILSMEKTHVQTVNTGTGCYDVTYAVDVSNSGTTSGTYDLVDDPKFDDDFEISAVSYTTDAVGNLGGNLVVGPGSYILANDQTIASGKVDNYTVVISFCYDFTDASSVGDEIYTPCQGGCFYTPECQYKQWLVDLVNNADQNPNDGSFFVEQEIDLVESNGVEYIRVYGPSNVPNFPIPYYDCDGNVACSDLPQIGTTCLDPAPAVMRNIPTADIMSGNLTCSPTSGASGLLNQVSLDSDNDGTFDMMDEVCVDLEVFDLALTKIINTAVTPAPYTAGSTVQFTITVYNQGTLDAYDVDVADYTPIGLGNATLVAGQTGVTENAPNDFTIDFVPIGGSVSFEVESTIDPAFTGDSLINDAEITGGSDTDGGLDVADEDSTPGDNNNPNDPNDNDTDATDGSDDQDPAVVEVSIVCEIDAVALTSTQCVDNNTPSNPSDDRVQIGISVTGTGSSFTLSVDGSTTITPSSGTIGSPGLFLLGPGTAGSGSTYTITIEDAADLSCNQMIVVQAPENCESVFPCPTKDCGGVSIRKIE